MTVTDLRPGDNLLYSPKGVFGWLIAMKTWHPIAHIEVYVGDGQSVAARDGVGVGLFPWRNTELRYVLRPRRPIDVPAAMQVFRSQYQGQGYDWLGLLRFESRAEVSLTRFNNKQFCSEFATRFDRAMGLTSIFYGDDADAIAPFEFLLAEEFDHYEVTKNGQFLGPTR